MTSKDPLLCKMGTLALAFCAILNAQPGTSSKWGNGPHNQRTVNCTGCVRDLSGHISQNPAPVRDFRSTHPCPANGSLRGPCPGYLVDHIKALKPGTRETSANLRWRTITQAVKERPK